MPNQYLKFIGMRKKAKKIKWLKKVVWWWRNSWLVRVYGRWQLRKFRKLMYSTWIGWEQDQSCKKVRMGYGTLLVSPENIELEDDVFVWHHSILDGTGGLEIGSGTQIGSWVGIFTHSSHMSIRLEAGRYFESTDPEGFVVRPVKIGRNVFIASGSKIGPGVTIGDNVIIAMNSVITKDVPSYAIVGGIPAKIIGSTKDLDKRYLSEKRKRKKTEK